MRTMHTRLFVGGLYLCWSCYDVCIVFILDAEMRHALVLGKGVWPMGSVRFPPCVSI